jgi:hypothetical protein
LVKDILVRVGDTAAFDALMVVVEPPDAAAGPDRKDVS